MLNCNQNWRMDMFGSSQIQAFTPPNQHMRPCSLGAIQFDPWERIWKSWALGKCKFFLWLVAHNRCWTADRLAKRGLNHPPKCPLCDEVDETIDHLLVSCVFTRQFWLTCCSSLACKPLLLSWRIIALWTGGQEQAAGSLRKFKRGSIL